MRTINKPGLVFLITLLFSCNTPSENGNTSPLSADSTMPTTKEIADPAVKKENISNTKTANLIKSKLQAKYSEDITKNIIDSFSRRFRYFEFDLNDDGVKEIFVGFTGPYFCGSGGCSFDILNNTGERVSHFTVSEFPVAIEKTKTNGWYDLVVTSRGKNHLLKFDGKKYPSDPGMSPAYKSSDTTGLTKVLTQTQETSAWFPF